MKKHKTSEVFVPGGMPYFTYIPRTEKRLEERLRSATNNLCKLITVTGATKSGKTVLTNKVFPRSEAVWIDGGMIREEDDLWTSILEQTEGVTETSISKSRETGTSIRGTETQLNIPFIFKGQGSVGDEYSKNRGQEITRGLSLTPRASAISHLKKREKD